jgi:non-specific serine/threonine protein kinase
MRQCPECDRAFDDGLETCPHDGMRLLPPDPLVGRTIEQQYRIDALVGRGGMGAVYRAVQTRLDRTVAVKVIRPDCLASESTVERFRREALALARIRHPNIVTIHDFGIDPEAGAYLVMELLAGRSLAEEVERRGHLPPATALDLLAQVASAVHAAHDEGVIHRELKPANILLEPAGDRLVAKVLDFGVVRLQESTGSSAHHLTVTGVILGTPLYMSPEQCEGESLDARSDVYALGCVLYEALAGQPPFRAKSLVALLQKHAFEVPEPPSAHVAGLAPEIDALVLRALAKRPEDRFATAFDLRRAIEAAARGLGPSAGAETTVAVVRPAAADRPARGNLPVPMTSFVGREREIAAVGERLAGGRLVTLKGIGGIGKTRLAIEAARAAAADFEGGAWLVELAPLKDASLLSQTVAAALEVREAAGRPVVASLCEVIGARRFLLVLDNCEHLVAGCASLVAALLAVCPGLTVLATSRETLGVAGEAVLEVAPLSLPRPDDDADHQAGADAVRLFLDRVRLHNPRFEPIGARWAAIAELCHRLDGIPLAIELAAARARVLSIDQIVARLDDRFQLLRGSDRSSMHRQQTLRAAIDWSYDLLSEEERVLLSRLSIFVGGCSLEAVERVCSGGLVEAEWALDLLARLADKSLVQVEERGGEARYSMLETIRQYGLERLRAAGEEADLLERHRAWFLALAAEAEAYFSGPEEPKWLDRIESEHDNLRAVLRRFARDGGDAEGVATLACILGRYWEVQGRAGEGWQWFELLLAHEAAMPTRARGRFLRSAGWFAKMHGDLALSRELLERSIVAARESDDRVGEARGLSSFAATLQLLGEFDEAWASAVRSYELFEEVGYVPGWTSSMNQLGLMASDRGDAETARAWYVRCIEHCREVGDKRSVGIALFNLAVIDWFVGDLTPADGHLAESRGLCREIGDRTIDARIWLLMGAIANDRLDAERAIECFRECLAMGQALGDHVTIVNGLEHAAGALVLLGRSDDALRIVGVASAARAALQIRLPEAHQAKVDPHVARAREDLGDEAADRALAEGRALTTDEAIRLISN